MGQMRGLIADMGSDVASVRRAAAWALGKLRAKESAPQIAKLLEDEDADVRWAATGVLGRLGQ